MLSRNAENSSILLSKHCILKFKTKIWLFIREKVELKCPVELLMQFPSIMAKLFCKSIAQYSLRCEAVNRNYAKQDEMITEVRVHETCRSICGCSS